MSLNESFVRALEIAEALGLTPVNKLPGCCEITAGSWVVAVNGHAEPTRCSAGVEVPPYSAYVQFNGWPAGIIDPRGGVIAAGSVANEDALIDALDAKLKEALHA